VRALAFVLTLAFGGLQTVAWSDCCCAPAETTACTGCEARTEPAPKDDCCGAPERPASEKRSCVHVQPSRAVVVDVHDAPLLPDAGLLLPLAEAPSAFVDVGPRAAGDAVHRPERGRPLHLLVSCLLI
jgi:hypothetical protein